MPSCAAQAITDAATASAPPSKIARRELAERLLRRAGSVDDADLRQLRAFPISGRVNGTYRYTAELENSRGVTTTGALTLKVVDANPAKPVLSHDNWDNDGNFTVTANMWWGTNATSAQFYENGMPVGPPVTLTAATPKAQVATLTRTGKAKATYTYTVVFTNAAGATSSASLAVKVTK